MDERIKGMWVDALLSGEYPKTTGYLHDDNGYCAYGVLCELAAQEGVVSDIRRVKGRSGSGFDRDHWRYDRAMNQPPESVMEWADLPDAGLMDGMGRELWMINDRVIGGDFDDVVRFLKGLP